MGSIAELVIEGYLCEVCGVWLEDILEGEEASGYPGRCEDCEEIEEVK